MDTAKLNDWLQLIGIGGVIASLVFVGFELQQSRQIAIADVYQQRTGLVMQAQSTLISPERWEAVFRKVLAGDELDEFEIQLMDTSFAMWFSYHENSHFQVQMGLLSEEHWETGRNHIRYLTGIEYGRDWWKRSRGTHRESFAEEVDRIVGQ